MTATTLYWSPLTSRALETPEASAKEVEVCPIVNKSCSLSLGLVYPDTSS